ncbi:MAG: response regulator [Cyclobacteriaceae bacterium]
MDTKKIKPLVISIVDDDEIYQFTIKKTLDLLKLTKKILMFSDGEEAIDFLHKNIEDNQTLPDIIFLDINMPVMDGFEFMEEFIKLKPRTDKKIIVYMVSSSVDPADLERAEKISEISDYIIKPIEVEQVLSIVESLKKDGYL